MDRLKHVDVIPVDLIDGLTSENIKKKEYDRIIKLIEKRIEKRICYVFSEAFHIMNRDIKWFDFDNENGEYSPGYFDPQLYKHQISFVGEYETGDLYNCNIPTTWLLENFEQGLKDETQLYKNAKREKLDKEQNEAASAKARRAIVIQSILDKLSSANVTKEELSYIKFK